MPVQLEMIEQASAEDIQDLVKIYQEYNDDSDQDTESWLKQQLGGSQRLLAGRFNSRLLGALWVSEPEPQHWLLQHLCVRAITRRRGVARQIMQLLAQRAQQQQVTLLVDVDSLPTELCPLLTEIGFEKHQQQWLLVPKGH